MLNNARYLDVGEVDSLVLDNKIYRPGTLFKFSYKIKSDSSHQEYRACFEVDTASDGRFLFDYKLLTTDEIDVNVVESEYVLDYIHLYIYESDLSSSSTQSQVAYFYGNSFGVIGILTGKTGLREDTNGVYLHPPRSNFFKYLEISSFPRIERDVANGDSNISSLSISKDWIKKLNLNTDKNYLSFNKKCTYVTDTIVELDFLGQRKVIIGACETTNDELGLKSFNSYIFDEDYGFVLLDYRTYTGFSVSIELEEIVEQFELKFE